MDSKGCYFLVNHNNMTEEKNLDQKTIAKIEKELLHRKETLVQDLEGMANRERKIGEDQYKASFPEYGDKPDENAQEISDYTSNLANEEVLEKNLRDVETALERIKNGNYGKCKYCGKIIDPKRLEARPTASSCIHCKTELQNN